jgi:hypothetical protein
MMKKAMTNFNQKLKSKFIVFPLLLLSLNLTSFKEKDEVLKIDYFGEINLPEEMEVQAGRFKEKNDVYAKDLLGNLDNHQSLVFQQKGLNSADSNSFKTYARVVVDTYKGKKETYKKLSQTNNLNNDDIGFYKNNFEIQVQNIWPRAKMKLIRSNEILISTVGNNYCTKHSYIRQLENSPPVFVEVFRIQNNDRVHLITFSYRIKDETQWKKVMEKILNSIKVIKF